MSPTDTQTYLCDIPAPDKRGRVNWFCAVCAVEDARTGTRMAPVPVTVKRQKIRTGWVAVPLCAAHEEHYTMEQRNAVVLLMFTERKFKERGGGPLTDADFVELMSR